MTEIKIFANEQNQPAVDEFPENQEIYNEETITTTYEPALAAQAEKEQITGKRFGTFNGVIRPTILTILGVMMYLREGWLVGNAGLLGAIIIILMCYTITGHNRPFPVFNNNQYPFRRRRRFYARHPEPGAGSWRQHRHSVLPGANAFGRHVRLRIYGRLALYLSRSLPLACRAQCLADHICYFLYQYNPGLPRTDCRDGRCCSGLDLDLCRPGISSGNTNTPIFRGF